MPRSSSPPVRPWRASPPSVPDGSATSGGGAATPSAGSSSSPAWRRCSWPGCVPGADGIGRSRGRVARRRPPHSHRRDALRASLHHDPRRRAAVAGCRSPSVDRPGRRGVRDARAAAAPGRAPVARGSRVPPTGRWPCRSAPSSAACSSASACSPRSSRRASCSGSASPMTDRARLLRLAGPAVLVAVLAVVWAVCPARAGCSSPRTTGEPPMR